MCKLKTLLLFLSVMLLAGQGLAVEPPLLSKQPVGPFLSQPGKFFSMVESAHMSDELQAKRRIVVKELLGGESGYAHKLKRLNYSTTDELAEEYMRSFDGYMTTAASLVFFSDMLSSQGIHTPPKIMNDVVLANGKHILLPAQDANILYGWTMNEIDKISARRRSASVAGHYRMVMQGQCPFADGDLDIVQHGADIEGRRHEQLLLWGRVGEKLMFMQFAEIKYYEVYGTREHAAQHYPGRPSDIYRAAIDDNRLQFAGMHFKECRALLKRVR